MCIRGVICSFIYGGWETLYDKVTLIRNLKELTKRAMWLSGGISGKGPACFGPGAARRPEWLSRVKEGECTERGCQRGSGSRSHMTCHGHFKKSGLDCEWQEEPPQHFYLYWGHTKYSHLHLLFLLNEETFFISGHFVVKHKKQIKNKMSTEVPSSKNCLNQKDINIYLTQAISSLSSLG